MGCCRYYPFANSYLDGFEHQKLMFLNMLTVKTKLSLDCL
ncbi:hypothetical protein GLIP_3888 [Aliiglaciecola lipolytica E3]|uniref:Uncharacterized protein n=1 Tax=Aliiglaciecola lipolytica E3 TaxID=1127673 RepID=K6X7B2_9ALTE|nr:hypothetical protein GLIP_3888 [Aliiglaciecola lipolytica E3]